MLTFLFPVSDICLELLRIDETSQNRAGVSESYLDEGIDRQANGEKTSPDIELLYNPKKCKRN